MESDCVVLARNAGQQTFNLVICREILAERQVEVRKESEKPESGDGEVGRSLRKWLWWGSWKRRWARPKQEGPPAGRPFQNQELGGEGPPQAEAHGRRSETVSSGRGPVSAKS